jgi:hypothetical protein
MVLTVLYTQEYCTDKWTVSTARVMEDQKLQNHIKITINELEILTDRKIVFRLLRNGVERQQLLELMKPRSERWVDFWISRFKANPEIFFSKPKSGRPQKMTRSMKRTAHRNLCKKNKKKFKSPRNLENHFKESAEKFEGIVPVSQ